MSDLAIVANIAENRFNKFLTISLRHADFQMLICGKPIQHQCLMCPFSKFEMEPLSPSSYLNLKAQNFSQ